MDPTRAPAVLATAVVVVTLVATGPAVGPVENPAADGARVLGDGDATVRAVTLVDDPRITPGRFGTGVQYLRVPTVRATVGSVTGTPRLVYTFAVPELGFERVATRLLDGGGSTVVLGMSDRAFDPDRIGNESYTATVAVRIQSFTTDRTLRRRNVTVEVVR